MSKTLTYKNEISFIVVLAIITALVKFIYIDGIGMNDWILQGSWKETLTIFIFFTIAWILRKKYFNNNLPKYFRIASTIITLSLLVILLISTILMINLTIRLNREDNSYSCLLSSGYSCNNVHFENNSIIFTLINGMEYPINLSNPDIAFFENASCSDLYICPPNDKTCTDKSYSIKEGANATIILKGCNFKELKGMKETITLKYEYINPISRLWETLGIQIHRGVVRF